MDSLALAIEHLAQAHRTEVGIPVRHTEEAIAEAEHDVDGFATFAGQQIMHACECM